MDELPPLGLKLTGYRLLTMSVVITLGVNKAILTYMDGSAALTALDWVMGTIFILM